MTSKVMTQEDLLKVCQLLARKYRSNQELDDLISEGYLAGLESIQKGQPKENTYTIVRKAMHAYYNIKLKPVTMPLSGNVLSMVSAVARGTVPEDLNTTQMALVVALEGITDDIKPNTLGYDEVSIEEERMQELLEASVGLLSDNESQVVKLTLEGKSPNEVVSETGLARSTVINSYNRAVDKLKGVL